MSASHPAACENCDAPLHGPFCHRCGQAAHSPVRSFAHAVEEVFESFWHLDGRIFRTLRRLLVPGALAADYLAGRRAPYVAPMRLFVILCVLAFFVGKLTVHFDEGEAGGLPVPRVEVDAGDGTSRDLARAGTVADVERIRERAIADLEQTRAGLSAAPAMVRRGVDQGIDGGIAAVRRQADRRIAELGGTPAAPVEPATPPATAAARSDTEAGNAAGKQAGGWLERQVRRIDRNLGTLQQDPERLMLAFLGGVPTMLFLFVPLFALLLKLFYLGSGRLYLEHLVVALYSHAFLSLVLLAQFLLLALEDWAAPRLALASSAVGLLSLLLWLWVPAYLLLMQRRVYGQPWWLTALKFLVIGSAYTSVLVVCVTGLLVWSIARL